MPRGELGAVWSISMPPAKGARLRSVAFTPDGRHVLTASLDGTVRTYSCELCGGLDELVTLAQQRLARTTSALTPGQRARYLDR